MKIPLYLVAELISYRTFDERANNLNFLLSKDEIKEAENYHWVLPHYVVAELIQYRTFEERQKNLNFLVSKMEE
jgi:hypothetical protein